MITRGKVHPKMSFVPHTFRLADGFRKKLIAKTPSFGYDGFGEVVYYRTYARRTDTGVENWGQTVTRVTEGTFSILKSHLLTNKLEWNQNHWLEVSEKFAESMFDLKWSPPGRGLWAMGTDHVRTHGSMALNNCGFVDTTDLIESATWTMDALMKGCGIGFNTAFSGQLQPPNGKIKYTIPDTREGWVESLRLLLTAFHGGPRPEFDYTLIRPPGVPIRGFGGVSSGYEPLKKLHERIINYGCAHLIHQRANDNWAEHDLPYLRQVNPQTYTSSRFVTDVFNAIGACVVSGNVRRSSQIALGDGNDDIFLHLKNTDRFPERMDVAWNSNNSVVLKETKDFSAYIPRIARQIRDSGNGEPGILNLVNVPYGRVGRHSITGTREDEPDQAIGINPCGEIPLESYELCNVVETFPSKCTIQGRVDEKEFESACEFATLYASIVSLLPTNSPKTNRIISRNRRIGVSVSGSSRVYEKEGYSRMIDILRLGHRRVRIKNREVAQLAGVPESIRVTTVKPSGTISKLAGVPEGLHFPLMGRYILRRMRVSKTQSIAQHLIKQGVPHEDDTYSDNTYVFEFPIDQGESRSIDQVSVWEQIKIAELHQRWWSENSCSATFMYTSPEAEQLEEIIAASVPNLKSMSFAPQTDLQYQQAPVEAIDQEEYLYRKEQLAGFSLAEYTSTSDSTMPLFCDTNSCEI